MKLFAKITLATAMAFIAVATLSAQPVHNDTLRTNTWSIYMQGGVGGFHGMRGDSHQYEYDNRYLAPVGDVGVFFYPRPWMRLGLGANYTYLKSADPSVYSEVETIYGYRMDGYSGTLHQERSRIQNKNFTHALGTDLTLGVNFLEIWRERKCQWFNIWASLGVGYMHGWNNYTSSWAVDSNFISDDMEYYKNNSSVESPVANYQFNTMYVPLALSMEFDIVPQVSLAVYGQYKYFPLNIQHTPVGMWSAGVGIRFNIVNHKGFKTKGDRIRELESRVSYYKETRQVDTVVVVDTVMVNGGGLLEVDKPLTNFAVQIYAFRVYEHAPDDKIFYNDRPTIYRNNGLRRYVIFTGTLDEAKKKLQEVRARYHDAFIVHISDDGVVSKYVEK